MGDPSGDTFKLLDVDSTEESRARNIHLDQSVYRWASWQGYVQDNEEMVWDEKTTVGLLTASKHRKKKKGQVSYEGEWEEVARDEAEKEWGGVFQHPSEGGVSRGVMSNVKQHTEMSNKCCRCQACISSSLISVCSQMSNCQNLHRFDSGLSLVSRTCSVHRHGGLEMPGN